MPKKVSLDGAFCPCLSLLVKIISCYSTGNGICWRLLNGLLNMERVRAKMCCQYVAMAHFRRKTFPKHCKDFRIVIFMTMKMKRWWNGLINSMTFANNIHYV